MGRPPRGDELVVVYRVWGGHPRRHETRWTAIDLRSATWAPDLGTPRVGELGDHADPVPVPEATERIPVVRLMGGPLADELRLARERGHVAADAPLAIYGRSGGEPELIVVTRAATGQVRSAAWALRPTEDPGRAESPPRQWARGAAGAVDVGTAPLQGLLLLLGVVRIH